MIYLFIHIHNYSARHEIPFRCPSRRFGDRPCLHRAQKGLRRAPWLRLRRRRFTLRWRPSFWCASRGGGATTTATTARTNSDVGARHKRWATGATDGASSGGDDDDDTGSRPDKDSAHPSRQWNDEAGRRQRDKECAPGLKTRRDPDRNARIRIGGLYWQHRKNPTIN